MPKIRVNNINLHYRSIGSGPPLVLLHGLGSSSMDWEYQVPDFARHYRVIAPCLRGFGRSDKPRGPYTIPAFADDVRGLLDAMDIDSAHVLGFSLGGAVAFQLAVDHPERVRRLVVVNSQPCFALDHWRKHMMVITRVGMASLLGMQRMARFVAKRMFPLPEQDHLRKVMLERHCRNDKACYLAALQALAGWSVADQVTAMRIPTLVISGEHDYCSTAEREEMIRSIPGAQMRIIAGSRHGTPFDAPLAMNRAVIEFLEAEMPQRLRAV